MSIQTSTVFCLHVVISYQTLLGGDGVLHHLGLGVAVLLGLLLADVLQQRHHGRGVGQHARHQQLRVSLAPLAVTLGLHGGLGLGLHGLQAAVLDGDVLAAGNDGCLMSSSSIGVTIPCKS